MMLETNKISYVIKVGNLYLNRRTKPISLVADIEEATHFKELCWTNAYRQKIDLYDFANEVNGQIVRVTKNYKEELYKGEIK